MKPGDLVKWKKEYLHDDDRDIYEDKIGLIVSHYTDEDNTGDCYLFNILLDGEIVGGFDYELDVVN